MRGSLITDDITIIKCAYGRDWFYIYIGVFYEDYIKMYKMYIKSCFLLYAIFGFGFVFTFNWRIVLSKYSSTYNTDCNCLCSQYTMLMRFIR